MSVRDKIVEYAKNAVGCDYDYDASSGIEGISYNCSFLSTCAYRHAGIDIPYWQGHQNGTGSQSDWVYWNGHWTTNPENLKPGDLVFFGESQRNTGHVGISLGGYKMIDSVPNGGVDVRDLYGSFVGGGWPLSTLPEDIKPEPEPEPKVEESDMVFLIRVANRNTVCWFDGCAINDLTAPRGIEILKVAYSACHHGDAIPEIVMTEEDFAIFCQCIRGGFPKHLADLVYKYEPRSPEE